MSEWFQETALSGSMLLALKSHASATALAACRQAVQFLGGMGFADEGPAGVYLKHAMVLAARYGNAARTRALYRAARVEVEL